MTPREALLATAELIGRPGAWTQGGYARDADGWPVDAEDNDAVCWCPLGAVKEVSSGDTRKAAEAFLEKAAGCYPPSFNDTPGRTQSEVVALCLRAAELAGESEASNG